MRYLKSVQYKLPNTDNNFSSQFLEYLSPLGNIEKNEIKFQMTSDDFFPITSISFSDVKIPQANFIFNEGNSIEIKLINTTGVSRNSDHKYSHIHITEYIKRIKSFNLKYIDHTGFNLPHFDGIHPQISMLRRELTASSLYHTFPKHLADAPWDFILPGSREEIDGKVKTNYTVSRKPKIEIVSFDKSSIPLMQLDIQLECKFLDLVKIFPEAIAVYDTKSLWVYLKNDFGIDICFVLNEAHEKDWSIHFSNARLF
jgi:hypothetical protein